MAMPPKFDPTADLPDEFLELGFTIEELEEAAEEMVSDKPDRFDLQAAMSNVGKQYGARRPDMSLDYSALDKFGISNYDVFMFGGSGEDNRIITEEFLKQTVDSFRTHGAGTYDCVLRYRYEVIDDDIMRRWTTAWRATTRRIRDQLSVTDSSMFVVLRYEILSDPAFVAVSLARMSRVAFNTFRTIRSREAHKQRSVVDHSSLKKYI